MVSTDVLLDFFHFLPEALDVVLDIDVGCEGKVCMPHDALDGVIVQASGLCPGGEGVSGAVRMELPALSRDPQAL